MVGQPALPLVIGRGSACLGIVFTTTIFLPVFTSIFAAIYALIFGTKTALLGTAQLQARPA